MICCSWMVPCSHNNNLYPLRDSTTKSISWIDRRDQIHEIAFFDLWDRLIHEQPRENVIKATDRILNNTGGPVALSLLRPFTPP